MYIWHNVLDIHSHMRYGEYASSKPIDWRHIIFLCMANKHGLLKPTANGTKNNQCAHTQMH